MFRILIFSLLTVLLSAQAVGKGKLVAGPIQGHTTVNSIKIWLLVKNVDSMDVRLINTVTNQKHSQNIYTSSATCLKNHCPVIVEFNSLRPDNEYHCEIVIDGKVVGENLFKTYPDDPAKSFSFMIGSCAVNVPNVFKPFHPGNEDRIYPRMAETPSDFMLWLGDYLYYVFFQYRNYENMFKKNISKREKNKLHEFLLSKPQYSIWDDHDYGPNDGDSRWPLRESSLDVFKQFWPNPNYGLPEAPGCFFKFEYLDTEFFMTDNRYYRMPHGDSLAPYLGNAQLNWLKSSLKESSATFKFIATGSQVINEMNEGECFLHHKREINELFNFIKNENITGVIFLSGDRHFTELLKMEREDSYPFYEFTSSPITSIGRRPKNMPELSNPQIVEGTLALRQNYGRVTVSGKEGNRICLLETFNNKGELEWSYTIEEQELK